MVNLILSILMNIVLIGLAYLLYYINTNKRKLKDNKFIILTRLFVVLVCVMSMLIFANLITNILSICGVL